MKRTVSLRFDPGTLPVLTDIAQEEHFRKDEVDPSIPLELLEKWTGKDFRDVAQTFRGNRFVRYSVIVARAKSDPELREFLL